MRALTRTDRWVTLERVTDWQNCWCTEVLVPPSDGEDPVYCWKPGVGIKCMEPARGRLPKWSCYCDDHGGEERARLAVLSSWSVAAPESVGDDEAVMAAGAMGLDSRCVYVVVRPENGRWIAALGVGSYTQQVRRQDADPERARKASPEHRRQRPGRRRRGGGNSWATFEEAAAAGVLAWGEHVAARVAEITAARGGTLAWGVPVEPREMPEVVVCEQGESAWEAIQARPDNEIGEDSQ
jgi:hypothetical protein